MTTIQHDDAGFLTGARIDLSDEATGLLRGIHADVAAIRTETTRASSTLMAHLARQAMLPPASARLTRQPGPERARDTAGRFIRQRTETPVSRRSRPEATSAPVSISTGGGSLNRATDALNRATATMSRSLAGTSDVDPTLKAVHEIAGLAGSVKDVAAPIITKPFAMARWMMGRGKTEEKQEKWLGKIWKLLKEESERPRGGGRDSSSGGILKLLLGLLSSFLPKIPGMGLLGRGLGGLGRGAFRLGGGLLRGAGRMGGGLLRGAGQLGLLATAGLGGYQIGEWLNENAINPLVQRVTGDKSATLGTWLYEKTHVTGADGKEENIVAVYAREAFTSMSTRWDEMLKDAKSIWQDIKGKAQELWGDIKDEAASALDTTNQAIKDVTGVDVGAVVSKAASATVDFASRNVIEPIANGAKAAGELAGNAWNATKSTVSGAWDSTKSAFSSAAGSVSELIHMGESKRRGYNDYNRGSDKRAASNKANLDLENMTLGEIMAQQALPVNHKDRLFAVGKYQVVPKTMQGAVKALGLDPNEKFSAELQERIFSEYLATSKKGRGSLERYIKSGKGSAEDAVHDVALEWASVESPKLGRGAYDGVGNNFAHIKSAAMVPAMEAARRKYAELIAQGLDEKTAYATALGIMGSPPATVTASAVTPPMPPSTSVSPAPLQVPAAPKIPVVQPPSAAPSMASLFPITSTSSSSHTTATAEKPLVGQDVSDRKIAHITTGGIAGV
jgi:uncharacterized protein YjbJ (UPF0337 family)